MNDSRALLDRVSGGASNDDLGALLAAIDADTGRRWSIVRRFKGGANGSAWLLTDVAGRRAVLKVQASDPERILAADRTIDGLERLRIARRYVEIARGHGWPTPPWEDAGRTSDGISWVLQAFIDGVQPPLLDAEVADRLIAIFNLQAGMLTGHSGGWDAWVRRVIYEDGEGLRGRIAPLPGGDALIRRADEIAAACADAPISGEDLVHGDFNLTNCIADRAGLWIIDAESLHCGPRALDPLKALIVADSFNHATPEGLDRLWAHAADYDPREFALCAAAAALKIAEGVVRHRLLDAAPALIARKIIFLEKVRRVTGF